MSDNGKLCVIWSSADRDAALGMVLMYTKNSKLRDWWDEVRLLIWGPSGRLLEGDEEILEEFEGAKAAGVELVACKACADKLGTTELLESRGVEVKYTGVLLTEMLKEGWKVLTF